VAAEPIQHDGDVDVFVGVDPRMSCGGWVIDELLSGDAEPLACDRRSATDRTLRVHSSSTPLLGHDPDTWRHSVRADPTVDSSSSRQSVPVVARVSPTSRRA
jgi:hypothetical protein